jgi:hypothetical protein
VGILADNGDFVMVVARGPGTDRQKALNAAWIDAVRLAVGTIISSKSELNNDEFAENTIAHSRGVIDSFDILDEQNDGKRTTVTIQAKVHKEILKDATKIYIEAQTVKANTGETVKIQMDAAAKDATAEDKQKSGAALLQEVLEAYGKPELFYSATLDPKVYYDKDTKQSYIKIAEKFNEDIFWKEFLPKLRKALDGVAEKKVKKNYSDESRKSNQNLAKNKRAKIESIFPYGNDFDYKKRPYNWRINYDDFFTNQDQDQDRRKILFLVPDNNASFTAYILPCELRYSGLDVSVSMSSTGLPSENLNYLLPELKKGDGSGFLDAGILADTEDFIGNRDLLCSILEYAGKMGRLVMFSVTFLDKDGNEIYSQPIHREPPLPAIYGSFCKQGDHDDWRFLLGRIGFAPGFPSIIKKKTVDFFLDTKGAEMRVDLELDVDDLQKVDSMKLEVVFEQW